MKSLPHENSGQTYAFEFAFGCHCAGATPESRGAAALGGTIEFGRAEDKKGWEKWLLPESWGALE